MAQLIKHDNIREKWARGKKARRLEQEPYSAMIRYTLEVAFRGPWEWIKEKDETDGEILDAAKSIENRSKEVAGSYPSRKLKQGVLYEVQFVVKVTHEVTEEFLVELELIHPDETVEKHVEDLNTKPRNIWVGLKAGEFKNEMSERQIEFYLKSAYEATLKKGLIVYGVVIVPRFRFPRE